MSNKHNCLRLGPTPIGSKNTNMGNDVFDQLTLPLKKTPEAEYLLNETEAHLKNHYKEIYDETILDFQPHP